MSKTPHLKFHQRAFPLLAALALACVPALLPGDIAAQSEKGPKKTAPAAPKKEKKESKAKEPEPAKKKQETKSQKEKEEDMAAMILETLEFGVNKDRRMAINKILLIKDKDIQHKLTGKLVEILQDETDPEVAVKTITVLGDLKDKRAVPGFLARLEDQSVDVRTAAVYGLKSLDASSAKDTIIKKLEKEDLSNHNNFTEALINTLGHFKAKELIPFTEKAIEDEKTHKAIREYLVLFLGSLDTQEPKKLLLKLYKDQDEDLTVRSYAVNSLAKLKIKDAAGEIKSVMAEIEAYSFDKRKDYYTLYMYSVGALAGMGDQEAIPKLMNSLRSDNSQVRLKAIMMLKDLKSQKTIDILKYRMKNDSSRKVRKAARNLLKEFGVDVGEEDKTDDMPDSGSDE